MSNEFNRENAKRCLCPTCAVQATSECVAEMMTKLGDILEPEEGDTPGSADFPGVYCLTGFSPCADIGIALPCSCGTCELHTENGWGHWKYCVQGRDEAIPFHPPTPPGYREDAELEEGEQAGELTEGTEPAETPAASQEPSASTETTPSASDEAVE